MRPVHLTVEGLACFREKQEIDFQTLELFAISGPTGAGKSTLLDAITFALYGEIPRVNYQSRTEMISAARDRVSVVLDFEVGSSRYRIARTLRRNGVQAVRLEERDGVGGSGSGKTLADQVRAATDQVAEILGLGAPAFMQAVVLPQGEFARFLKAPPRDRRSMLRTLLRLDVYERMREQAQRLSAAKKGTVDSLQKLLADEYAGIDEAAVAGLKTEHARVTLSLEVSRKRRDDTQATLARLRGQHAKTRELRQVEEKRAALEKQAEQVSREQARIEAAARAVPLLPLLHEAARATVAAKTATKAADVAKAHYDSAQKDWKKKAGAFKSAEKAAEAIPTIREQVARLHQVLGRLPEREQLKTTLERQAQGMRALQGELSSLALTVESAKVVQAQQQRAVDAARQAAEASGYDPELDELLQSVRDRAVELGALRRSASERRLELARKRKAVAEQAGEIELLKERAASARRSAEEAQRGSEAAEEALHRANRLNEANHLRGELVPGQPCPVCEQLVDTPPPAHLAPELEAARAALQGAREQRREADALARQNENAATGEQARLHAARQSLAEMAARCAELLASVAAGEEGIWRTLGDRAPEGDAMAEVVETWIETKIAALARSRKANAEAKAQLATAERTLERARAEEAAARDRLGEREALRQRLEEEQSASLQRLTTLEAEIRAVTESADPAAEARALEEQIRQLEADLKAATEEAATAQNHLMAAKEAQRLTAEAAAVAREHAIERTESRDLGIARAGFDDEAAVRLALLDDATAARLQEQVHKYVQDCHIAEERVATLRTELGEERVSDEQLAAVEKLAADLTTEVETALGREKKLEEQIARMKERLERGEELRLKLDIETASLSVYDLLAGDLRSDKFQAYVLEEVFTELVEGASARLLTLTGERYSLEFNDDQIRVVDHDNADETRISDTLSGGETFLTSLALALELSDQVQRAVGAVNLDSLFIDEGFGTLDPDTLALVAETLQGLRVGGRMVGIITHIPELRDEFAQQVIVTKRQGYSTVEVRGLAERA
ncbi:MAG TPA: SMC family ATPase [Thermoanaerobaculia bacterium]|nr:SMC family ATPase [Thermoanaerobaculia bacterium]